MKLRKLLLIAFAFLLVFCVQPTYALNYEDGHNTVPTLDGGWVYDQINAAYTDSVSSSYDFTLTDSAYFRITDYFIVGDIYSVWDGGSYLGDTDFVGFSSSFPDDASANAGWMSASFSSAEFFLTAGVHSLAIQGDGAGGIPAGFYTRLDTASVPDASIMLLLGSSLFGLGVFSRKSKKS